MTFLAILTWTPDDDFLSALNDARPFVTFEGTLMPTFQLRHANIFVIIQRLVKVKDS